MEESVQGRSKERNYREEEEEEEQEEEATQIVHRQYSGAFGAPPHPSPSSSSSTTSTRGWPPSQQHQLADAEAAGGGGSSSSAAEESQQQVVAVAAALVEKEHMFDKVVTPSDVGKLNRLVIPKQHAEKYFPLDASTNDKGLLLNFEDRTGKPWRFRYSYWNSSQSYVMTKGWSRFVKEKRLDAGDTVSFGRGVGEHARDRLFIDWKRRPDLTTNTTISSSSTAFHHRHLLPPASVLPFPFHHNSYYHHQQYDPSSMVSFAAAGATLWDHRRFLLPPPPPSPASAVSSSTSAVSVFDPHYGYNAAAAPSYLMNLRSVVGPSQQQQQFAVQQLAGDAAGGGVPVVFDSVPVLHRDRKITAGKRVRLFGVNLDCSPPTSEEAAAGGSRLPQMHSRPLALPPAPPLQLSLGVASETTESPTPSDEDNQPPMSLDLEM